MRLPSGSAPFAQGIRRTLTRPWAGRLALGVLGLGLAWLVARSELSPWDFRHNLWAPAHLLWQGQSPYQIGVLFPQGNAVWLPPAITTHLGLGLWPLPQAAMLWGVASGLVGLALLALALDGSRPSPWSLAGGLLVLFLYPPVVMHLRLGQISLLIVLYLVMATRIAAAGGSPLAVAVPLVPALAKPQLLVLAVPGLVYWLGRRRGRSFVARLMLWGLLGTAVSLLPFWLAAPDWTVDFARSMARNPGWQQPSLFSLLSGRLGPPGVVAWLAILLVALGLNLRLWRRLPARQALMWSLAATPLVSPYVWSWDFVLALPLLLWAVFNLRGIWVHLWLALGYAALFGGALWVAWRTDGSNHRYWWLSWLSVAVVAAAVLLSRRLTNAEPAVSAGSEEAI